MKSMMVLIFFMANGAVETTVVPEMMAYHLCDSRRPAMEKATLDGERKNGTMKVKAECIPLDDAAVQRLVDSAK